VILTQVWMQSLSLASRVCGGAYLVVETGLQHLNGTTGTRPEREGAANKIEQEQACPP
jgi:hypothetical protein